VRRRGAVITRHITSPAQRALTQHLHSSCSLPDDADVLAVALLDCVVSSTVNNVRTLVSACARATLTRSRDCATAPTLADDSLVRNVPLLPAAIVNIHFPCTCQQRRQARVHTHTPDRGTTHQRTRIASSRASTAATVRTASVSEVLEMLPTRSSMRSQARMLLTHSRRSARVLRPRAARQYRAERCSVPTK
jgi:hypothetical protein